MTAAGTIALRGECPVCGLEYALRTNGRVWLHQRYGSDLACPGSGRYPRPENDHVHRCKCGAAWNEEAYR